MNSSRVQFNLANLAVSAGTCLRHFVWLLEPREITSSSRFLLVFEQLSLIPARQLSEWLSAHILHIDDVFELGDELVSFSAMQDQLGARVRLVPRLYQLHSLLKPHVLLHCG